MLNNQSQRNEQKPRRWMIFAVAVLLIAGWSSNQAWADSIGTSQLRISDGTTTVTLTDTDGDGAITYISPMNAIGNFTLIVTTGASRPTLGSASAPHLDLSSIEILGSGSATLTISYTDTGFTGLQSGLTDFTSMIGGSCNNCTGTYSTYLDSSNTAFGTATSLGTADIGTGSFSSTFSSGNLPSAYPYSLTQVVTVTMSGAITSSSFNAELQATPEPGSLVLLGSGMAGLGLLAWRRTKKAAAPVA